MDHERFSTAPKGNPKGAEGRGYHHGDLRNGLLQAAREILEEESLAALTLRAVARKAGVSHAAPYRHFPNHEALLVELSVEGLDELRAAIAEAAKAQGGESDKIANIGAAYMRFVAQRPALARLMFGGQLPNRDQHDGNWIQKQPRGRKTDDRAKPPRDLGVSDVFNVVVADRSSKASLQFVQVVYKWVHGVVFG